MGDKRGKPEDRKKPYKISQEKQGKQGELN